MAQGTNMYKQKNNKTEKNKFLFRFYSSAIHHIASGHLFLPHRQEV